MVQEGSIGRSGTIRGLVGKIQTSATEVPIEIDNLAEFLSQVDCIWSPSDWSCDNPDISPTKTAPVRRWTFKLHRLEYLEKNEENLLRMSYWAKATIFVLTGKRKYYEVTGCFHHPMPHEQNSTNHLTSGLNGMGGLCGRYPLKVPPRCTKVVSSLSHLVIGFRLDKRKCQ
ncbi:hypothetical protein BJ165DRAFT_1405685 [Panaeolus papilionaceus]|nr:hypothetical protein BJ165DRAFT_1405685 [Panaeolus papilionaceus]